MTNRVKLCFQVAWLVSAVVALVMSFNLCSATDQACTDANSRMFLVMVALSFPGGIFSLVAVVLFLEVILGVASDQLNEYLLFWWIMTAAGYLQWFIVVPKLFAEPKFTSLGLNQDRRAERAVTPEIALTLATSEPSPRHVSAEIPAAQTPKPRRVRPVRAYDNRGRTPLERALWSNPTNASS